MDMTAMMKSMPMDDTMMASMDMTAMQECMEACNACMQACTMCAGTMAGMNGMGMCVSMSTMCAEMCQTEIERKHRDLDRHAERGDDQGKKQALAGKTQLGQGVGAGYGNQELQNEQAGGDDGAIAEKAQHRHRGEGPSKVLHDDAGLGRQAERV